MRKDLLERLKANTSTKKEDVVKSLGEVEEALTETTNDAMDEYVDYEEVKDDSSNKMDNDIRQSITNREDIYRNIQITNKVVNNIINNK